MCLHAIDAFLHVLYGEPRDHDLDRLRPSGQELARTEPGCRLFAVDAFFDHDDVEPASDRRVGRAEPGKAAACDQEIASQIFNRCRRGRKIPDVFVVSQALPHMMKRSSLRDPRSMHGDGELIERASAFGTRHADQPAKPPASRKACSCGLVARPNVALRCGNRPKRRMMSACCSAYFVNSSSP